jgi:metallo-beta-lactamase family protein
LRQALLNIGVAGDQVILPLLDDAVELRAGGVEAIVKPTERRIDLNQINADWHNAYSSFIIDLSARLQSAASDAERLRLMAALKATLGVPPVVPVPTPVTPIAASGTIIHGEPSGE